MNTIEGLICTHLQDEGIGSVYERVVLSRFFRQLAQRRRYTTVLEYSCPITKGYDNVTFLEEGLDVTIADADPERLQAGWKFALRPRFCRLDDAPQADLVWNFAQIQMQPELIPAMKAHSTRDILIFVPNILNPGTPIHLTYHLLTRTACRHAERGSIRTRTRAGLLRLLTAQGIQVIKSGYIDAPLIPDIGFSIRELKATTGLARPQPDGTANGHPPADPAAVWRRVESLMPFEYTRALAPFKPVAGHHIYVLGRVA